MAAGNLVQGALFTVIVVRAGLLRDQPFAQELAAQVERSPRFFRNAPVVLDLRNADGFDRPADFAEAREALRRQTLTLVGVQNALPAQLEAAAAEGLASFAPTASQPSGRRAAATSAAAATATETAAPAEPPPAPAAAAAPPPPPQPTTAPKAMLLTEPVRSGTQIYAEGTDLVLTAAASPGSELVADGNIHVYGTLRGRALAGAGGDRSARIFCSRLQAELVSIAGHYLVSEQLPADLLGSPVQIALDDDRLTITRI